jgi:predicted amidohydrolase
VDPLHYRTPPGSLAISGDSRPGVYGGWELTASGIEPGKWYRFAAWYRAEGAQSEHFQVLSRLDWVNSRGKRAGWPDYVWSTRREGEWRRVSLDAPAPEHAAGVKLQLFLQNAPQATVWWDDISLDEIPAPPPRYVRIAAINLKPSKVASPAEAVAQFMTVADREAPENTDVILLPEGITVVGTNKQAVEVAEAVPGPTSERLGELARRKRSYVVAGIYEREGTVVYNTAILIDRAGRVAGKYRKVYLPRDEVDAGLTPGSDYPVFATDFGKVGIMICWDVQYADPARGLALGGAELVLLPIWGGHEALGKARAMENHVFLAASGYDYPTYVLDPQGEIVAAANERGKAALATIDLNRRYRDWWDGEMRGRFMKELRFDVNTRR